MKKFLTRVLLFGLAFFVLDKVFLLVIQYLPETEVDTRLEQLINGGIDKDVIIIGSSRGARTVIAGRIQEETGLTAYNLSYPGSDVEFHEFLLRSLVKFNKAPKVLLLGMDDPIELLRNELITFRSDRLYPLVTYDYIMQELIRRQEKSAVMSRLFVLHRMFYRSLDIRRKHFSELDTIRDCGSMTLTFQREDVEWTFDSTWSHYKVEDESQVKIAAFKNIITLCKKHNITLVLFVPPLFQPHNTTFENRIRQFTGEGVHLMVYDTTRQDIYRNPSYYYDTGHLKENGATEFTSEVIAFLRNNVPWIMRSAERRARGEG